MFLKYHQSIMSLQQLVDEVNGVLPDAQLSVHDARLAMSPFFRIYGDEDDLVRLDVWVCVSQRKSNSS